MQPHISQTEAVGVPPLSRERAMKGFGPHYWPTPKALETLCASTRPRRLRKGDMLFAMGRTDHLICWVDTGLLRLFYLAPTGDECTKVFFRPGGWFMTGFEPGAPSSICVQACTDALIWTADLESYLRLIETDHSMALAQVDQLNRHVAFKHWRELSLLTLSGTERYQRFVAFHEEWIEHITQSQIASTIGVTPTQLSRIRRKLGLIPGDKGQA